MFHLVRGGQGPAWGLMACGDVDVNRCVISSACMPAQQTALGMRENYRRTGSHPAAWASDSEQNHRSPFAVLIWVCA